MQYISYLFASIISSLGLLIGMLLVKIAPEEQKLLGKKLYLARNIILILIFAFAIFYYFNSIFYFSVLAAYIVLLLFTEYKANDLFKKAVIAYAVLGVLFFLSSKNTNLFIITSSLILLYGLPTASLMYNRKKRIPYKVFSCGAIFVIISNLLFFV